jgi:hypothetical protein
MARVAGVFYLITIVAAIIAQGLIAERLVNSTDASVTARNIVAHADLFRFGFTMYMIEMVSQTVMTMLFYELLKPVSRIGSLIAAVLGVVGPGHQGVESPLLCRSRNRARRNALSQHVQRRAAALDRALVLQCE